VDFYLKVTPAVKAVSCDAHFTEERACPAAATFDLDDGLGAYRYCLAHALEAAARAFLVADEVQAALPA